MQRPCAPDGVFNGLDQTRGETPLRLEFNALPAHAAQQRFSRFVDKTHRGQIHPNLPVLFTLDGPPALLELFDPGPGELAFDLDHLGRAFAPARNFQHAPRTPNRSS